MAVSCLLSEFQFFNSSGPHSTARSSFSDTLARRVYQNPLSFLHQHQPREEFAKYGGFHRAKLELIWAKPSAVTSIALDQRHRRCMASGCGTVLVAWKAISSGQSRAMTAPDVRQDWGWDLVLLLVEHLKVPQAVSDTLVSNRHMRLALDRVSRGQELGSPRPTQPMDTQSGSCTELRPSRAFRSRMRHCSHFSLRSQEPSNRGISVCSPSSSRRLCLCCHYIPRMSVTMARR